ncbi:MAG: DUF262 domain-containing protein [Acidobacteriota bacterium]
MSPRYQRRSKLWKKEKKAKLIDSVLNDYDIPKFYLADFTYVNTALNEAKTPYAVIDGKQRLETFFDFFEGKVSLAGDFTYNSDPSVDIKGLFYPDLKLRFPNIAQKYERYVPTVMSVVADVDEEVRIDEMFVRLNSGVQVNAAEKRNAMQGPVPKIIRKMVLHPFFIKKIAFDITRMNEFNAAAKILLIESKGKFVDTKATNLDAFVKDNKDTNIRAFTESRGRIQETLDRMADIFEDKDPILSTAGPIPLYYWFTRNTTTHVVRIRPFLEKLARDVRANLELSKEDPKSADAELSSYYTMSRTTNDQGSLVGRYEILHRRFQAFVRAGPQRR